MNCRSFQDNLFEYLDGELFVREQAAAKRHLEQCSTCRQTFFDAQTTAQSLSARFRQDTESLVLDPNLQTRITAGVENESAQPPSVPLLLGFWRSFALLWFRMKYFRENFLPRIARISRISKDGFSIREIRGIRGWISWVAACRAAWLKAWAALILASISLAAGLWLRHWRIAQSRGEDSGPAISLTISYCDPIYTFHTDGRFVVDSLDCQPRVVEESIQLLQSQTYHEEERKSPL